MSAPVTPRLMEIANELIIPPDDPLSDDRLHEIKTHYVKKVFQLVDECSIAEKIKKLWSKIEPLSVFDEDDKPAVNRQWKKMIEFRQDLKGSDPLSEEKEQALFCRIALFILEDETGNIIVSRRSLQKSHPGELELAGGHVIAWDTYLKTVYKELEEELKYKPSADTISENDRVFKYRNTRPGEWEYKGKGNILSIYRVKVPNMNALTFDPDEIEELVIFSPADLHKAIAHGNLRGKGYEFADYHAYWYLEYLQERRGIDTEVTRKLMEERGVMKNRTRISTFSENE